MGKHSFSLRWDDEESSIEWYKEGLKIFVYKWDTGNSYNGYGNSEPNLSIVTAENLDEANKIFFKHHSYREFYDNHFRRDISFSTHSLTKRLYYNPCLYSFGGEEIFEIKHVNTK